MSYPNAPKLPSWQIEQGQNLPLGRQAATIFTQKGGIKQMCKENAKIIKGEFQCGRGLYPAPTSSGRMCCYPKGTAEAMLAAYKRKWPGDSEDNGLVKQKDKYSKKDKMKQTKCTYPTPCDKGFRSFKTKKMTKSCCRHGKKAKGSKSGYKPTRYTYHGYRVYQGKLGGYAIFPHGVKRYVKLNK